MVVLQNFRKPHLEYLTWDHIRNEIKTTASAEIVSGSLTVVNPNGLLDNAYKTVVFNIHLSEEQKMQLQSQDILYDSLQNVENLEDLLGGYLQEMIRY